MARSLSSSGSGRTCSARSSPSATMSTGRFIPVSWMFTPGQRAANATSMLPTCACSKGDRAGQPHGAARLGVSRLDDGLRCLGFDQHRLAARAW